MVNLYLPLPDINDWLLLSLALASKVLWLADATAASRAKPPALLEDEAPAVLLSSPPPQALKAKTRLAT